MKTVAIFEAKARFSELLTAVQDGEEFSITRHGRTVARLVAPFVQQNAPDDQRRSVMEALQRLRSMRQGVRLEGDVQAMAAAGRD